MAQTLINNLSYSTLDATKLSGNLPAISGASLTGITTGKVLQIVQGTSTSQFSTSSTSFVKCTQISATITPSSSSSKILIHIMGTVQTEQYTRDLFMDICRNIGGGSDTFLSGVSSGFLRKYDGGTTIEIVNGNMNYLDSPNTSSSIVYTPAIRFGGGNTPGAEFGESNIKQTITLTEISA
jgi:hypothetical protein